MISGEVRYGRMNKEMKNHGTFYIEKNFRITGVAYYDSDEEVKGGHIEFYEEVQGGKVRK